jgi:immunoglobulin I-set domain protein
MNLIHTLRLVAILGLASLFTVCYATPVPVATTAIVGQKVTISLTVSGTAPFKYTWYKDGVKIANAAPWLVFNSVKATDEGVYKVVVSNAVGSDTSPDASLLVDGAPPVVPPPPVISNGKVTITDWTIRTENKK